MKNAVITGVGSFNGGFEHLNINGNLFHVNDVARIIEQKLRVVHAKPGLNVNPFAGPHSRNNDPATSHAGAPALKDITAQALKVLWAYAHVNRPLIDHEAYRLVGMAAAGFAHQRCSDLREAGFIVRTGATARTPSNKSAYVCVITDAGRAYLANNYGAMAAE